MNILVTGGGGFIASHVVDELISIGHDVAIIDNLSTGKRENLNKFAEHYILDLFDPQLETVFRKFRPEVVIHHAAQVSVQASIHMPTADARTNINGTITLLELCKKYGIRKFIYASSAAVYGQPVYLPVDEAHPIQPLSFYGISKYTPEQYINLYAELCSFEFTILRYANVYGPRQDPHGEGGVVSIFINDLLKQNVPIIFGDGEQTRDFIYVKDIASANVAALSKGKNSVYNISTNTSTSIADLYHTIQRIIAPDIPPKHRPARSGDIVHSVLENSRAIKELYWRPSVSLEAGLRDTCMYYSDIHSVI